MNRRSSVHSVSVGIVMLVFGLQLARGQDLAFPRDEGKHAGVAFESRSIYRGL